MPAAKAKRVSEKKRQNNAPLRTRAKNYVTRARTLIDDGDDGAEQAVTDAVVALDKAAQKGAVHKLNASRRKARLVKKLNSAKS